MSWLLTDSSCIIYMDKWVFMPLCFIQDLKTCTRSLGKKAYPSKKKKKQNGQKILTPDLTNLYTTVLPAPNCPQSTSVSVTKKFLYT